MSIGKSTSKRRGGVSEGVNEYTLQEEVGTMRNRTDEIEKRRGH